MLIHVLRRGQKVVVDHTFLDACKCCSRRECWRSTSDWTARRPREARSEEEEMTCKTWLRPPDGVVAVETCQTRKTWKQHTLWIGTAATVSQLRKSRPLGGEQDGWGIRDKKKLDKIYQTKMWLTRMRAKSEMMMMNTTQHKRKDLCFFLSGWKDPIQFPVGGVLKKKIRLRRKDVSARSEWRPLDPSHSFSISIWLSLFFSGTYCGYSPLCTKETWKTADG